MLRRKVIVCFSTFLFMIILGWRLDHNMQSNNLVLPSNTDGHNVLSAKFNSSAHINMPFLPREYVRIIRKVSD